MRLQQRPVLIPNNGRQLLHIANEQQLHSPKGLPVVPIPAQDFVNPVEHIGPHHTDFVNNEQIEGAEQVDFFAVEPAVFPPWVDPGTNGPNGS